MKLSDINYSTTQRVLIVGLPGTGKSTLAANLAENFKLKWLDIENGKATLQKLPKKYQDNIDLISIPDSASFPVAAETLLQLFKTGKGSICVSHGKYSCALCKKDGLCFEELDFNSMESNEIVVVDTATQLSNSILAHTMKNRIVTERPDRDDWGAIRRHTEYMASQFQAAQFNLIVICHALEAELQDGKKKLVPNFGSAGMSASFAGKFDHVIYCDVINMKHKAFSSSTHSNGILTRSRTGFKIEDLSEPKLLPLFIDGRTVPENIKEVLTPKLNTEKIIIPKNEADNKEVLTPGQIALNNLRERMKKK